MGQILIKKGLNLPFTEQFEESRIEEKDSQDVCIDLSRSIHLHLKPSVEEGKTIKKGDTLAQDTHSEKRIVISPYSGTLIKIQRGHRRRITGFVIKTTKDTSSPFEKIDPPFSKEKING